MTGRKILIVEDNAIIAMETVDRLKRLGYSVTGTAATGQDAIRLSETTGPDCILMDINLMGDMDGIEAARQIAKRRPVPVIYVTAYSDEDTLRRAMASNPFRYLVKPYREHDLYVALDEVFRAPPHPAEPRLPQEARSFVACLDAWMDGVIMTGDGGVVEYLNGRAIEMTGFTKELLAGKPLSAVMTIASRVEPAPDPCTTGSVTTPVFQCTLMTTRGTKVPAYVVMITPGPGGPVGDLSFAVFWEQAGSTP